MKNNAESGLLAYFQDEGEKHHFSDLQTRVLEVMKKRIRPMSLDVASIPRGGEAVFAVGSPGGQLMDLLLLSNHEGRVINNGHVSLEEVSYMPFGVKYNMEDFTECRDYEITNADTSILIDLPKRERYGVELDLLRMIVIVNNSEALRDSLDMTRLAAKLTEGVDIEKDFSQIRAFTFFQYFDSNSSDPSDHGAMGGPVTAIFTSFPTRLQLQ